MNIWQIAAGDGARDYTDLYLKHDVMLIGPGSKGDFTKNKDQYPKNGMTNQIRSFCNNPQSGDIVLLRYGHEVKAVGLIPDSPNEEYLWLEQFDDVLGWDLQHVRRVLWSTAPLAVWKTPKKVFSNYKQQSTFTAVHEKRITDLGTQMKSMIKDRPLNPLPSSKGGTFSQDELGMELFNAGLPNNSVEDVIKTISRIQRLSQWYSSQYSGNRPSEHEIVAHMIVPLMLGMGWSEQLLAIEWTKIDLAFFNRIPTESENCFMICEAKRPNQSLTSAYEQAQGYVQSRNLLNCKTIVTTDGKRLYLYKRKNNQWKDEPDGYINLLNIKRENVFPFGTSGINTLIELIPWKAMIS